MRDVLILVSKCFLLFAIQFGCIKPDDNNYFRGKVEYNYTYESNILNPDSLTSIRPHTGIMIFEGPNYQSIFQGKDTMTYIYDGTSGWSYGSSGDNTGLGCEDYRIPTDSVLSYKVYDAKEKILGHDCLILDYQSKYFRNRYYVSKKTRLDPTSYAKHQAYNWNFYASKTNGGLILKMEHYFKNYTMLGTASKVIEYQSNSRFINTKKVALNCELYEHNVAQ